MSPSKPTTENVVAIDLDRLSPESRKLIRSALVDRELARPKRNCVLSLRFTDVQVARWRATAKRTKESMTNRIVRLMDEDDKENEHF